MDFPALYIDTETSDYHTREQPSLPVQIALLFGTFDRVIYSVAQVISQTSWVGIPFNPVAKRVSDIHEITESMCQVFGIVPDGILHTIRMLLDQSQTVVAHNIDFDISVIDNAMAQQKLPPVVWPKKFCTMRESAPIVRLPAYGSKYAIDGYKPPKLAEAYRYFARAERKVVHDALADVYACRLIHRAIVREREKAYEQTK